MISTLGTRGGEWKHFVSRMFSASNAARGSVNLVVNGVTCPTDHRVRRETTSVIRQFPLLDLADPVLTRSRSNGG